MRFLTTVFAIFIPVEYSDPKRDAVMWGTAAVIASGVIAGVRDFLKGNRS